VSGEKTYPVWVGGRCVEMTQAQVDAREQSLRTPEQRIALLEVRVKMLENLLKAKP
jgi:hypothetical protein